jgi:hypothetical protein
MFHLHHNLQQEWVGRERVEQFHLTISLYVEPLASHEPTTKEVRIFEQKKRSRELKVELEATLNFLSKPLLQH